MIADHLVLALFGPTASGKTQVAEALADRLGAAELVSADSAQVYRGLPILTNQSERPAHLQAIWPLSHEASVGEYQELAHATVDRLLSAAVTPIVVGGTGLYLRAALGRLELPPPPAPGVRERWGAFFDEHGPARAHAELTRRDPGAAAGVHPNDRRRVVRALELAEAGASLSPRGRGLWSGETRHPTLIVGLEVSPDELERRIERRAAEMLERGVAEEVRRALGGRLSSTARKIMGLREVAELPPDEARAAIALRNRQLAAYQRKWMRRLPGLVRVRADRSPTEVADEILEVARAR